MTPVHFIIVDKDGKRIPPPGRWHRFQQWYFDHRIEIVEYAFILISAGAFGLGLYVAVVIIF